MTDRRITLRLYYKSKRVGTYGELLVYGVKIGAPSFAIEKAWTRERDRRKGVNVGRGWHGDPEAHGWAGKIGGKVVAQDRQHMAEIGRLGGRAVSQDRQHMSEIGKKRKGERK